jgi:autotransporter-associated beta strand protein
MPCAFFIDLTRFSIPSKSRCLNHTRYRAASIIFFYLLLNTLHATPYTVSTNGDSGTDSTTLRYALLHVVAGDTITFDSTLSGGTITLLHSLPAITQNLTITGPSTPLTIDGGGTYQAFSVGNGTVVITNLNVNNAFSKGGGGGDGRNAGGGGAGGGGALYIQRGASLTVGQALLSNNVAQGGNGGAGFAVNHASNAGGGGGGGGFGENGTNKGGTGWLSFGSGGGGGGHTTAGAGGDNGNSGSVGGTGGIQNQTAGGGGGGGTGAAISPSKVRAGGAAYRLPLASTTYAGGAANSTSSSPGNGGGGAGLGGPGGDYTSTSGGTGGPGIGVGASFGGGGGGGGGSTGNPLYSGGAGTGAGGGGGGATGNGGAGGSDGGGGGAGGNGGGINVSPSCAGGAGGFGGGGGGGNPGGGSSFGGGSGGSGGSSSYASGGGGAGMGGAIYMQENSTLVIQDGVSFSSNSVFAGAGGVGGTSGFAGNAYGLDLFMKSGSQVLFENSSSLSIMSKIESDQDASMGGGIEMNGSGVLTLGGVNNTYTAQTVINSGTISISNDSNLGISSNTVRIAGGTLETTANLTSSRTFTLASAASIVTDPATTAILTGQIKGTGSLTKGGTGELDFSNANISYSGGTNILAGTLKVLGTSLLSGAMDISSNAIFDMSASAQAQVIGDLTGASMSTINLGAQNLNFGTGNDTLFAGSAQGSGGVMEKLGAGTVTFSAPNTYTGGTFIRKGTLSISGSGSLASTGALNLSSGAIFDISSSSGSQQIGDLTGSSSSLIQLGANQLIFGTSNETNFAGNVEGSGGVLHKIGSGTAILTGMSEYDGGTILEGGIVEINTNSALGYPAGAITIADDSTLRLASDITDMNRPILIDSGKTFTINTNTYVVKQEGVISGTGALTKTGKGRLTLSGVNLYTGLTTISNGVLVIASSGQIAGDILVQAGSVLAGSGVVNGAVSVHNGAVINPGNPKGILTVGSLALSPLSVTLIELDPFQGSRINVTSATAGSAALAGILNVKVAFGDYSSPRGYTILHSASPITTMFDGVILGPQAINAQLFYSLNDVILQINSVASCTINTKLIDNKNGEHLANYLNQLNGNQALQSLLCELSTLSSQELNTALNSISPARNAISSYVGQNTMFLVANTVSYRRSQQRLLTRATQMHSEENISMELFKDLPTQPMHLALSATRNKALSMPTDADSLYWKSLIADQDFFESNIDDELEEFENQPSPFGSSQTFAHRTDNYDFWIEGLGELISQDSQLQNPSYNSNTGGILLGFDYYGKNKSVIGAAVCYAKSFIHEKSHEGNKTVISYAATLYGTAEIGQGYIELGVAGAYNAFKSTRSIPQFNTSAHSSHKGYQVVPHFAMGYDVNYDWGTIEPFVSFDCAILFQDGFSEHGAVVWNMQQHKSTSELLRSEMGLSAYEIWNTGVGDFVLRQKLSYVNKEPFQVGLIQANLVNYPVGFTVNSFVKNESFVSPSLEFLYRGKHGGYISVFYMGEFQRWSSRYMSNNLLAKIGMYF